MGLSTLILIHRKDELWDIQLKEEGLELSINILIQVLELGFWSHKKAFVIRRRLFLFILMEEI